MAKYNSTIEPKQVGSVASGNAEALRQIAEEAYAQGRPGVALVVLQRAWCLHPDDFLIAAMAAVAGSDIARFDLSRQFFLYALRLDPSSASTRINFSSLLLREQSATDAIFQTERAIAFEPNQHDAYHNRGVALQAISRITDARRNYRQSIALMPVGNAQAETNLGQLLLSTREYGEGWALYAQRFRAGSPEVPSVLPTYQPETGCRRLLLWGDQGLGDQIMFGSMIADLQSIGQPFALQVDDRLVALFQRAHPEIEVLGLSRVPDKGAFDARLALGDLGALLRNSDRSFARQPQRYLAPAPDLAESWRARLRRSEEALLIGLSWWSANPETGRQRSLGPEQLGRLLSLPGARFVNLQYGSVVHDLALCREQLSDQTVLDQLDDLDRTQDIDGLAAVIEACDLVITIGNTTAHLAAALGKLTWVLLPKPAGWRWMNAGSRTPWYPSARLYRQHRVGDWSGVLADVQNDFRRWVAAREHSTPAT